MDSSLAEATSLETSQKWLPVCYQMIVLPSWATTQVPHMDSEKCQKAVSMEGGALQTKEISLNVAEMVIHEQGNHNIMHSSTLTAGKDGCVVLVFPKSSFGPFLDEYPGLLLSLLGTQVVV